jgi:hypothetical protein
MMLMRRRHIGGIVVVSFRAFLVAAYTEEEEAIFSLPRDAASVVRE